MNKADNARYLAAGHRVQSATAYLMNHSKSHEPKHLRTGINILFASQAGLAKLLIEKGVFTQDEYDQAVIEALEGEGDRLTAEAREISGVSGLNFG